MNIVLAAIGSVFVILNLVIWIINKNKYQNIIDDIDGNDYFMKDVYFVGFQTIDWLKINFNNEFIKKKTKSLSELYGAKKAQRLVIYDVAAQLTYIVLLLPIAMLIAVIADDVLIFVLGLALIALLSVYVEYDKKDKLKKKHEELEREFPHIISQVALLVNAGMPLKEALAVTASKPSGVLTAEIQLLVDDMKNGIPDYEALGKFADRCGVNSVRKFASLINQNMRKGSSELAASLMELSSEIWRNRVNSVKEEGEKASSKLLFPILIIFAGILIMVAVPMFTGLDLG